MNLCFAELPLGTEFEFFGRKYRKIAPSMSGSSPTAPASSSATFNDGLFYAPTPYMHGMPCE